MLKFGKTIELQKKEEYQYKAKAHCAQCISLRFLNTKNKKQTNRNNSHVLVKKFGKTLLKQAVQLGK